MTIEAWRRIHVAADNGRVGPAEFSKARGGHAAHEKDPVLTQHGISLRSIRPRLERIVRGTGTGSVKAVVLAGMFPPPVHGMATINSFVERELRKRGSRVIVVNLSPGRLSARGRFVVQKTWRVLLGLSQLLGLARRRQVGVLYMALSGGHGQLYDLLFILLARLFGIRLFLHHHSFAYVDRRRRFTQLIVGLAGVGATHIVLCDRMRSGLEETYRGSLATMVLSNFAFVSGAHPAQAAPRFECTTIGFLSNISPAKGIMLFLDIADRVNAAGFALRIVIAGPFENPRAERSIGARIRTIGGIDYRGAVYGRDKEAFFDEIDVLVFPSQYVHEAEPVTVIEALTRGIPVMATARGCLPTMVPLGCGLVVPGGTDFVESAVRQLRIWVEQPDEYRKAARAVARWAECSREVATGALSALCSKISEACGA